MPVALVTGANRGLGLETVRQLLERGYDVHATYRTDAGGLELIDSDRLSTHQADVRDMTALQGVMRAVGDRLDVLFNNAGVSDGRWASIEEVDFDVVSEVLEINAISPVRVTQLALPLLQKSGFGKVVMISSLMASIDDC